MRIRPAAAGDRARVLEMARHFLEATTYGRIYPTSDEQLENLLDLVEQLGTVLLAESPLEVVGMLGLVKTPHPFNGAIEAGEVCWWIEPRHRQGRAAYYLLRSAEDWARQNGCGVLKMVAPNSTDKPNIAHFYETCGFGPLETTFYKVL